MKIANLFLMLGMFTGGMYTQTIGGLTQAQKDVLNTLEVVYLDDCQNGPGYKTLRVKNANLQVVNGTDETNIANGLGNIIIGYNEQFSTECDRRGSHNLILGRDIDYAQVVSNVLVGTNLVCNGSRNIVHGQGHEVHAIADSSVVLAGADHLMHASNSAIIAGSNNYITSTSYAAILGGQLNVIPGTGGGAVVTGGESNVASGFSSTVSGGQGRVASNAYDWVAGSLFEDQ